MRFSSLALVAAILVSSLIIGGCDPCEPGDSVNSQSELYFSAKSIDSDKLSVYGIDSDGNGLRKIAGEAKIFSGAAIDGKLVFITETEDEREIFTVKESGGEPVFALADDIFGEFDAPLIDRAATSIAFVYGQSDFETLFVSDVDGNLGEDVSTSYYDGYFPAFSDGGEYIAFLEKSGADAARFVIYDLRNSPPNAIRTVPLDFDRNEKSIKSAIDWNYSKNEIVFSTDKSEIESTIYFLNFDSGTLDSLEILDLGAESPNLGPDGAVAFVSKSGDLWITKDGKFFKISETEPDETYAYPEFSPAGDKLVALVRPKSPPSDAGTLKIIEIDRNADYKKIEETILIDRAERAFWNLNY